MLEYQYFLLSIKSSDEPMYSLCCRRTLSDVLEGVTPNFILGASPQTRHCLSLRLHALMAIAFKPLCILPSTGDGTCLGSHEAFTPPPSTKNVQMSATATEWFILRLSVPAIQNIQFRESYSRRKLVTLRYNSVFSYGPWWKPTANSCTITTENQGWSFILSASVTRIWALA